MFQKFLQSLKSKRQKGQSLIFFGITVPILMVCVGAAADFGWLYLNQSRLQSAADAAATAGANRAVYDEMSLSDYSYTTFVANSDSRLQSMYDGETISSRSTNKAVNGKNENDADEYAKAYAEYTLKGWDIGADNIKFVSTEPTNPEEIKFDRVLYGPDSEDYDALYYTVTLSTKLEHLFGFMKILDKFGVDEYLPAKAMAAVKISHVYENSNIQSEENGVSYDNLSLYVQMKIKEESETYPNWEEIKLAKGNNSTQANNRSVLTGGASYTAGDLNRTEASLLTGQAWASSKGNPYATNVSQYQYDDLFIDYQGEMNRNIASNSDVDLQLNGVSGSWRYGNTLADNAQDVYRVHFPVMINSIYTVRSTKKPPDSLYAYIEQEPIIRTVTQSNGTTYNRGNMSSVRQIIICNNTDNTTNTNTQRPWVFFYEGPEIPTGSQYYDSDGDYIGNRPYLPIILNLNKDWRGIIFAPNNPVVINGNGHKLRGFIVAREFKRLKTTADFKNATDINGNKVYAEFDYPYSGLKGYADISTLTQDVTNQSSVTVSGTTYVKVKVCGANGTWYDNCYVQKGQWYTNSPSGKYQLNYGGDTTKYAYTNKILLTVPYNGKYYLLTPSTKFYVPVTQETVTYTGNLNTTLVQTITDGGRTVYNTSGKTIIQDVTYLDSSNQTQYMYVSGTSYSYTESYYSTEGKNKTRPRTMAIGDVQFETVSSYSVQNSDGTYTESPEDAATFKDDDGLRYDYVNVFNLNKNSTYDSFYNVKLLNYTYLAKNETGSNASNDMFFTTYRSKHID